MSALVPYTLILHSNHRRPFTLYDVYKYVELIVNGVTKIRTRLIGERQVQQMRNKSLSGRFFTITQFYI